MGVLVRGGDRAPAFTIGGMAEDDLTRTLDALAEAVLPGGAAEAGAPDALREVLARMGDEVASGVGLVLDGYADGVRSGAAFADLSVDERGTVLRAIASEDDPNLQQLVRLSVSLVVAAVYGERSGLDASGGLAERPASWDRIGYPGPSTGYELRPASRLTDGGSGG